MNPLLLPWRTGRKLGRTVYAMLGPEASDSDPVLGMMDSRELAAEVVATHNLVLRRWRRNVATGGAGGE